MPPTYYQPSLSPAELSYIHTSLSLSPPIRPDSRSPTQFRPLVAESDILPSTNGSARICFADGTEAIVGVKAEVEKSGKSYAQIEESEEGEEEVGKNEWLDLTVEIPATRDDDSLPVFLSSMLAEALLADGAFTKRLYINRRFHWKLYIDVSLSRFSWRCISTDTNSLNTDPPALLTPLVSSSSTITDNSSRPPLHSFALLEIRKR